LAVEIEKVFAVDVELEPGEFHSFDVLVDGNLIFSKFEEDRFPEPEEIVELIRAYLDQKENVSREIIGVSP
jgi:selT/selW/selH-like putative selenoprotein